MHIRKHKNYNLQINKILNVNTIYIYCYELYSKSTSIKISDSDKSRQRLERVINIFCYIFANVMQVNEKN